MPKLFNEYTTVTLYQSLGVQDCEQCGGNYEDITVTLENGTFDFSISIGCYGGASEYSLELDEAIVAIDQYKHLTEFAAIFESIKERMRELWEEQP